MTLLEMGPAELAQWLRQQRFPENVEVVKATAGGEKDSGHSAAIDATGRLWTWGCDRWQQLGLGGGSGAVGYTWENGKIWRNTPQLGACPSPYKPPAKI